MILPLYTTKDIQAYVSRFEGNIKRAIIAILERRGEQFVAECRSQNTWTDQTGNLRSSIGYFIFDGKTSVVENLSGDSKGINMAKEVIKEMKLKKHTMYLIGVAGMNYAAAVESKGYNVISAQSLMILPLIESDIKRLVA